MITLVTGGIKSGKSDYALRLMEKSENAAFIATADPDDESMRHKIENHRKERINLKIRTYEEKLNLSETLASLDSLHDFILVDCLTMWMSNLLYLVPDRNERDSYILKLLNKLSDIKIPCILITNEVGLGIIPENKVARMYGEELGMLNRQIAAISGTVILMVSGLPVKVK